MEEGRETVAQERCAHCKSTNFKVNHYLKEYHHDRIFLQCSDCGEFAARIIVHAYIDPDAYNSFLAVASQSDVESARKMLTQFEEHAKKAIDQARRVSELLVKNKDVLREKNIQTLLQEYHIIEDHS